MNSGNCQIGNGHRFAVWQGLSESHGPSLTFLVLCMVISPSPPSTPLPPFTFMLTQVKLSGSGSCLIPSAGVYSDIMAESNHAVADVPEIPGSLGEWKEVFYTGKSLHPRADLSEVRGTKDDCCLLLLPSSKEPSFLWTLALVTALGSAASASCTLYHSPHKSTLGTNRLCPT